MEPNPPSRSVYLQPPEPTSPTDSTTQPPKKSHRILSIVLGSVGGLIVIFAAIASIALAAGGNSGTAVNTTATLTSPIWTPAPTATRALPAELQTDIGTQSVLTPSFTVRGATQDIF